MNVEGAEKSWAEFEQARLRVPFICIFGGQENPTRGPEYFVRNSAESPSGSEGGNFLVPQQCIMMDTFSRPHCNFLRFYMNSVSSAYSLRFFAFVVI